MSANHRLPRLLGSEPDIKLNEQEISDKIKSNFQGPTEKNEVFFQNMDKPSFLDFKKQPSYPKAGRLVKLNSSDVYEITGKGKIRAIHSNEAIITTKLRNSKTRPRSGKYDSRRPWSNRSYRKQPTGSSLGRPVSSKRTIF